MTDYTSMTDEELTTLSNEVMAEQGRRHTLTNIPIQIDTMNADYLTMAGIEPGEPWEQPDVVPVAYPLDWQVTHDGKTWVSTVMSNVWEPGVQGWDEVV